ncbi:hypothetical protein ACXYMO_09275 [Arenibacterium sp. CAU 1754]
MPCTYTLHKDINILHCRLTGAPSLRDILDLFDKAATEPGNIDTTNVIIDLLQIAELRFNDAQEQQLIAMLIGFSLRRNYRKKCAILADCEPGWSLAGRVTTATAGKTLVEFERIRDPSQALTFLDVSKPVELVSLGFKDNNEYN